MAFYDPKPIEAKWQKRWADERVAEIDVSAPGQKYYMLNMFPYPSGDLHVGHGRNYILGDALYRYLRMRGLAALNPMGWDAFGLPAENAAIKRGVHPGEWTRGNIERMKKQFRSWGILYDWSREIASCDPAYYRWNQWLFLKLFEKGLAYRGKAPVNWCPSCRTVLANEQVVEGRCERCGASVEQRDLEQWFFRITDYADRLDSGLDALTEWPEKVKLMQRNWIGKSVGADVEFEIPLLGRSLTIFTTRPDTIYGAMFMVLAPEHPDVPKLIETHTDRAAIEKWIGEVRNKSALERQESGKEGHFTGSTAINPFTGEPIPIWLGNFVLPQYGTGAIMAVPGHDQRDFEFAKQYGLPIRVVVQPPGETLDAATMNEAWPDKESGVSVDSGSISGMPTPRAIAAILDEIEERGIGKRSIRYRLRDWLISRQRYWGTPIPILYCEKCGIVPVPESDLPVELPSDVPFTGKEGNPLEKAESFVRASCPRCGGAARRETDTMDTFVDSSWYWARFISPRDSSRIFDSPAVNRWLPVDQYIGGIEHAILHLLYARFICRALHDLGLVSFEEPFARLFNQGMITKEGFRDPEDHLSWVPLGEVEQRDGVPFRRGTDHRLIPEIGKMSKSRFNVVPPDDLIDRYGADTERVYTLFIAPPEKEAAWSDEGVVGGYRFLNRVWAFADAVAALEGEGEEGELERKLLRKAHQTIATVGSRIDRFEFNTAISALMELSNALGDYLGGGGVQRKVALEAYETLLRLLHPFAPHVTEEIWQRLGHEDLLVTSSWPEADPARQVEEEITIVIQVNGKLRGQLSVAPDAEEAEIVRQAKANDKVTPHLEGKEIVKTIVVPGRLVNLVVR
ncbi:MAG TPA: leucine--tRNA ligase [Thermoanaerobaculia bacterium]|nr:leucine--tRNA ligase [Thermoanaerobaculia bacterium]